MVDVPAQEIAALLDRPLGEVVAARNARVKELRRAGERELARALAEVRRPSRLVWDVGQLAKVAPDEAAAAVAASEELEAAQEAGGSIRGPLRAVRDAIAAVVAHAEGDAAEVGLAVRTVLGDADARAAWLGGTLLGLPGDDDEDRDDAADAEDEAEEPEPEPDEEEPDEDEEPEPEPDDDGARAALVAVREGLEAVRAELEAARLAAEEAHAAVVAAVARAAEALERADESAAAPDEDDT